MKKILLALTVLLPFPLFVFYGFGGLVFMGVIFVLALVAKMTIDENENRKRWLVRRVHIVRNLKSEDGKYIYDDSTVLARAQLMQKSINRVWDAKELTDTEQSGKPWVKACVMGDGENFGEDDETYNARCKELERVENIKYQLHVKNEDPETYYKEIQKQKGFDWETVHYGDKEKQAVA